MKKGSGGSIPSSRFITRMVPVQATCFSGVEEIRHVVEYLVTLALQELPSSQENSNDDLTKTTTFAIQAKLRICGHLKRTQIIDEVAKQVVQSAPRWKVNLSDPDFTILIEVCKNIAGISVIPSSHLRSTSTRNFNLAELRTTIALAEDKD